MEGASQLRQSLVKLGTYQGLFAGGSSPGAVHVYHENKDACGDYYVGDDGAPPSPDYAYYDNWDGNSYSVITCINGTHHSAYQFLYRKGTVTSTPFFYGTLATSDGLAMAKTELQGDPPENVDWFGCTPAHTCTNTGYGLHRSCPVEWWTLSDPL